MNPTRKRVPIALAALAALVLAGTALCAGVDVDGALMRDVDDTAKSLDSNVAMKDGKAAAADARVLVETFARIESHYGETPDTADAVGFAHRTQELAAQALQAIEAKDFDAAGEAVNQLTRSCRNCHEKYKKD
jgi:soluble cytochrome b562